jgi:hypothetical protein
VPSRGGQHRRLTWVGAAIYGLMFAAFGVLGLDYVAAIDLLPAALHSHASNLVISGLCCLSAGVLLASVSSPLWQHLSAPVVAVVLNLVIETRLTSDNTPDLGDLGAGFLGAAIGFLGGVLIALIGTRPADPPQR